MIDRDPGRMVIDLLWRRKTNGVLCLDEAAFDLLGCASPRVNRFDADK
jgi:hypothetical protein